MICLLSGYNPAHLNSDKHLPGVGAQSGFDRSKDDVPKMTGLELRYRLLDRSEGSDPTLAPEVDLMDNVAVTVPTAVLD